MINDILKDAHTKKILVDIIMNDAIDDESTIGYVTSIDNNWVTLNEIDKFGYYDGNTIFCISNIKTISTKNTYLKKLKIVIENNYSFDKNLRVTIWKKGVSIIPHFLDLKNNKIITLFFFENNDFEIGILLDYDKNDFVIENIDQDGLVYAITTYRIDTIIGLRYNGLGEQKMKLLYEN